MRWIFKVEFYGSIGRNTKAFPLNHCLRARLINSRSTGIWALDLNGACLNYLTMGPIGYIQSDIGSKNWTPIKAKYSKNCTQNENVFPKNIVFQTQNSVKKRVINNTKVLPLMYIIYKLFLILKFHVKHFCMDATTIKRGTH